MWRYLLYRAAAPVVRRLDERVGYPLFDRLADVLYLAAPRTRRLVARNVGQALGPGAAPAQVRRVVRHVFRNLLWNYYEMFRWPGLTLADLQARVQVEGVEYGEKAAAGEAGALFVFPHVGNLEVLMQIPLLYPQYRFVVLVERMQDDRLFRLMNGLRATHGLQIAAATEMLRVLRLFRQGWSIVLAGDLDSTHSGVVAQFFGAPARMPDGAVRLALRTGAPLLLVYGCREPGWGPGNRARFRLCITPPVPLVRTGDAQADIRLGVQTLAGRLEALIAAHVDQWLAIHPIWTEGPP
jgi:KDO2-lipid IV(A) lauroyltransferase